MAQDMRFLLLRLNEGERQSLFGAPTYQRAVEELKQSGFAGVTVTRAEFGLDTRGHLQNIHSEYVSDNLPIILEMIVPEKDVTQAVAAVKKVAGNRLQSFETGPVVDVKGDGKWDVKEDVKEDVKGDVKWQEGMVGKVPECGVLKVYMKETDDVKGVPLYEELVRQLGKHGVTWANVITALEGYGNEKVLRRNHNFSLANQAPVVLEAVFTPNIDAKGILDALQPYLRAASGPAIFIEGSCL